MRRLVIGCGYLGLRVAAGWAGRGDQVWASTRGARSSTLRQAGLEPLALDVTTPLATRLPAVDTVLFAVGRDRSSSVSMHDIHERGLARILEALPASVQHVIYVSSTGVYGDDDGRWVDEASPCTPTRDGGRACLAGEAVLQQHARVPWRTTLRMAGLYGPGRLPHSAALLSGTPIPGSADAFLNLVHVDDAARVITTAAMRPARTGSTTYTVSDGVPLTRGAYIAHVGRHLGTPVPPFAGGPGLGKRVRNALMREELDVVLHYASLAEGLAGIPPESVTGAP